MSANSLAIPMILKHWPLSLRVLGVHFAALPASLAVMYIAGYFSLTTGLLQFVLVEGAVAAGLSRWIQLPHWWQAINLFFLPALWLAIQAHIEPDWYLAGFILLLLTSLGALTSRVPLYLSSERAVREVARHIPEGKPVRVVDLGCGLGGLLAGLVEVRPEAELHGIDAAPLPWLFSRLRLGRRAQIRFGNLWSEDLSGYDVVYAYLSPEPMSELWTKVRREMRPGSLFISNTFSVPDTRPDEVVELHDLSHARLLLWQIR